MRNCCGSRSSSRPSPASPGTLDLHLELPSCHHDAERCSAHKFVMFRQTVSLLGIKGKAAASDGPSSTESSQLLSFRQLLYSLTMLFTRALAIASAVFSFGLVAASPIANVSSIDIQRRQSDPIAIITDAHGAAVAKALEIRAFTQLRSLRVMSDALFCLCRDDQPHWRRPHRFIRRTSRNH